MNNISRWLDNFDALKVYVAQTGHFPNKHTKLNNWCRYQRKCIKAGVMPEDQQIVFEALAAKRSAEYKREEDVK